MNDDRFSLKARRTTRIPLRMPVHLTIQEEGHTRTLDGWTMIVNVHGARIECRRSIALHEEVLLQIPSNGKAQKGRVVWSGSESNSNGNFECGLELDSPENLWGVGFPPSDWSANRAGSVADLAESPDRAVTGTNSPESDPRLIPEQSPAGSSSPNPAAEPAGQLEYRAAPIAPPDPAELLAEKLPAVAGNAPQTLDLSAELLSWPAVSSNEPSKPEPEGNGAWKTLAFDPELSERGSHPDSETAAAPAVPAPAPVPCQTRQLQNVLTAPTPSLPEAAGDRMSQGPATDRLSAIFNELVESALQARLLGLAERLGARVEARIAASEGAALAHIEQQIHGMIAAQTESLQKHAMDLVTRQQQNLEQNVRKLLESAEATAIRWQQDSQEAHRQVMRDEMTELMMSRKAQLEQEISQLASNAWTSLRQNIDRELPSVEQQFVERCHSETERLLTARLEELSQSCSERLREAEQSANQHMEQRVEEALGLLATRFEARAALLQSEACGQIERQVGEISSQTRQAFLRHIVTELHQKQQTWLVQAQTDLHGLAEQNLLRMRQSLSHLLKDLGETLLRGAYPEAGVPGDVLTRRFAENDSYSEREEETGVVPAIQAAS